jgi:hypothetical protein
MDGHFDAFMLNDAGGLGNRWSWPGPSRDTWRAVSTPGAVGAVASVHYGTRHQASAIAVGGTVYYSRWQEDPTRWTGWSDYHPLPPLDGVITDIALLPVREGPLMLLALDAAGRIRWCEWQREPSEDFQPQAWTPWADFPGPAGHVTAIAADTGSSEAQLFIAACDGNVWYRAWWRRSGRWDDWKPMPAHGFRAVDLACRSEAEYGSEILMKDETGQSHRYWQHEHRYEIVAVDEAGQSHRNWIGVLTYDDGSQPSGDWTTLPAPPSTAGTGAVAGVALSSADDVAVVTPEGEIFRLRKYTYPSIYYEWSPWPVLPYANQVFSAPAAQ